MIKFVNRPILRRINKTSLTYFAAYLIFLSCSSNESTLEKEYIKNLEEKNKTLESELNEYKSRDEKGRNAGTDKKITDKIENSYFTIGSTEEEVLSVMGDPTSLNDMGRFGKIYFYGSSRVEFEDGKVHSYSNADNNLKVRVKK